MVTLWRFCASQQQIKPALLLHLTTPPRKCGTYMYPLITDSTVNKSTSDSMARVTPAAYSLIEILISDRRVN